MCNSVRLDVGVDDMFRTTIWASGEIGMEPILEGLVNLPRAPMIPGTMGYLHHLAHTHRLIDLTATVCGIRGAVLEDGLSWHDGYPRQYTLTFPREFYAPDSPGSQALTIQLCDLFSAALENLLRPESPAEHVRLRVEILVNAAYPVATSEIPLSTQYNCTIEQLDIANYPEWEEKRIVGKKPFGSLVRPEPSLDSPEDRRRFATVRQFSSKPSPQLGGMVGQLPHDVWRECLKFLGEGKEAQFWIGRSPYLWGSSSLSALARTCQRGYQIAREGIGRSFVDPLLCRNMQMSACRIEDQQKQCYALRECIKKETAHPLLAYYGTSMPDPDALVDSHAQYAALRKISAMMCVEEYPLHHYLPGGAVGVDALECIHVSANTLGERRSLLLQRMRQGRLPPLALLVGVKPRAEPSEVLSCGLIAQFQIQYRPSAGQDPILQSIYGWNLSSTANDDSVDSESVLWAMGDAQSPRSCLNSDAVREFTIHLLKHLGREGKGDDLESRRVGADLLTTLGIPAVSVERVVSCMIGSRSPEWIHDGDLPPRPPDVNAEADIDL